MYVLNFKLFVHRGQPRPFNYSHEINSAQHTLVNLLSNSGHEFHLHIAGANSPVVLALAHTATGFHVVSTEIEDIDAETLDKELPAFLDACYTHLFKETADAAEKIRLDAFWPFDNEDRSAEVQSEIGNVRNDIGDK